MKYWANCRSLYKKIEDRILSSLHLSLFRRSLPCKFNNSYSFWPNSLLYTVRRCHSKRIYRVFSQFFDSQRFLQHPSTLYWVSYFEMFPHLQVESETSAMCPVLVGNCQELDAIPVKADWLDRFVWESLHFPDAAISGSAYRGGFIRDEKNVAVDWVELTFSVSCLSFNVRAEKWRAKCAADKQGTEMERSCPH